MLNDNTSKVPILAIDLDGCVDEFPDFFSPLTRAWPGQVVVITYRSDREKAMKDLAQHGIRYDELILVDSFDRKAEVIAEKGIGVYVDDQPEMLKNVSAGVAVMLLRNEGNFDFEQRKWMLSNETGRIV